MESNVNKRHRTPNYTTQEKVLLMELVGKYKNILENKTTNAVTWREKDSVWTTICNEFNAATPAGISRDKESLKKCFENKKKEVRKVVAEEKRERRKTGGGGYTPKYKRDPCYGMIMEITNRKSIYGLDNPYDGDADDLGEENNIEQNDNANLTFLENDNENETEILTIVSTCNDTEAGTSSSNNYSNENVKTDWSHYKPKDLQKPAPKKLTTWSNRRRPKVIEPVHTNIISKQYSEVACLKRKFLEQEIEISKKKEERDGEKFLLEKKALLLDITLKEIQIKRLTN